MRSIVLGLTIGATLGSAALIGCRSDSSSNPDGGSNSPDAPAGGMTIPQVRDPSVANMAPVSLYGKVVTAVDNFGASTGNFWVEEPTGGVNSGVLVFGATNGTTLAPGDIVNITGGIKDEFHYSKDPSTIDDIEIEGATKGSLVVTKTGTGTVPAPVTVDSLAIAKMGGSDAQNAAWAQYQGVLVTLSNVTELSNASSYGSGADQFSFDIEGGAQVENENVDFPSTGLVRGACFTNATGVMDYFFEYNLLPTKAGDLAVGGTGCEPPEQGNLCADGIDNDQNGFADCLDNGCAYGSAAFLGTSCVGTAAATCGCSANGQAGASVFTELFPQYGTGMSAKAPVILTGVFVTAVTQTGFWVADTLAAAKDHGAFVYTVTAPPASIVIGAQLTVQGEAVLFGTAPSVTTELQNFQILGSVTPPTATLPSGFALAGADLTNAFASPPAAAGNDAAGVLVTAVGPWKVTTAADTNNVVTLQNNGATITIKMDDEAFVNYTGVLPVTKGVTNPTVGTCYGSITGVMDINTTDKVRTINPTKASDLVTANTCT